MYLYRAVDFTGATIDFLLSAKRDEAAAERFLAKALRGENHPAPRVINTDKHAAYPPAIAELKAGGVLNPTFGPTTKLQHIRIERVCNSKTSRRIKSGVALGQCGFFRLGPSTVVLPLLFCEMLSYGGFVADNDHLTSHQ